MRTDLILGTAGHIDHGKTSLVRALTGVDTDRLPEEKKRGITIELGYAHLDLPPYRLGIVDVPGHEKFIRQMLSGATGMDLAMLVVAADDSINRQTREHLDILRMLNLPAGIIVITKSDLVDPQWLELVKDEVRTMVCGTVFEQSEMIATSIKTMQGFNELKSALRRAADRAIAAERQKSLTAPFRMPIDRTFSMEGFGTVVTGSVVSGKIGVGDSIVIHPLGIEARIRGLQSHDESAVEVHRGQRAAINLAGIRHEQLNRGLEIASAGYLQPDRVMTLELLILNDVLKPLEDRTKVRFHLGTAESMGIVRLLELPKLNPGESGIAQIYLDSPTVSSWGQPFVIRQESPMITLGGGRILDPHAAPLKRSTPLELEHIGKLGTANELDRCEAAIFLDDSFAWSAIQLPATTGVFLPGELIAKLYESGRLIEITVSASRKITMHRQRFEQLAEQIKNALKKLHAAHPLRLQHAVADLVSSLSYLNQPEVIQAALTLLARTNQVVLHNGQIALEGFGPKLTKAERALLPQLVEQLRRAELQVPTEKELQAANAKNKDSITQLLKLAEASGDLTAISDEIYLHIETTDSVKSKLRKAFELKPKLTISDIRELLQTSRKYAVPLCEYLDRIGFTKRIDDFRELHEKTADGLATPPPMSASNSN